MSGLEAVLMPGILPKIKTRNKDVKHSGYLKVGADSGSQTQHFFFFLFTAAPVAYGNYLARGRIQGASVTYVSATPDP